MANQEHIANRTTSKELDANLINQVPAVNRQNYPKAINNSELTINNSGRKNKMKTGVTIISDGVKLKEQFTLLLGGSHCFARQYFNSIDEMKNEIAEKIRGYNDPAQNGRMEKENRLYWVKQYKTATFERVLTLRENIILDQEGGE